MRATANIGRTSGRDHGSVRRAETGRRIRVKRLRSCRLVGHRRTDVASNGRRTRGIYWNRGHLPSTSGCCCACRLRWKLTSPVKAAASAAVNWRIHDRRVTDRQRAIETVSERTVVRPRSGQPRPAIKSGVPKPSRIGNPAEPIAAPDPAVARSVYILRGLIARCSIVFRAAHCSTHTVHPAL